MEEMQLLTIEDYTTAYSDGVVKAREHLIAVWQQLQSMRSAPVSDTAIIYLPSLQQIQILIDQLDVMDPNRCPLWGVPFVVKDNIDIQGWPTSAACPEFTYVAIEHAAVVHALIQAGAVPIAKANLDQFATGLVGTRSPYGWVPNAFSDAHISGGSSSGSASVVARGLVPFSLGTDTAGSGRIPAAFNNLVGTKPTPGRFSMAGVVPACRSLDCVSIMTLTVADAAIVSRVLANFSDEQPQPRFHVSIAQPIFAFPQTLRVGIPDDLTLTDEQYATLFADCIDVLPSLGSVECVKINMSDLHAVAQLLYEGPWVAERLITAQTCIDYEVSGLDPIVQQIISQGQDFSALQTFSAVYRLKELAAQIESIWQKIDVMLVPSAPTLPLYSEVCADPVRVNSDLGIYTNFVNLLGWAAVATPAGFTPAGLPFGVTWLAPGGSDEALLELASRFSAKRRLPLGRHLRGATSLDHPHLPSMTEPPMLHSHRIAVVGAHLSGMPLNGQLQAVGARLSDVTTTRAHYRLYHLPNTTPPKPGLVRVDHGGASIALEVYDVPCWAVSFFLQQIPSPLGLGKIELANGQWVTGFICEPVALTGATDITDYGGWRAYMQALATK
jgi:allophanate hydrolase